MLDYFLRRDGGNAAPSDKSEATAERGGVADDSAKQSALLEADQLADDEVAAVDFILQCRFADARLRAAEHVHTRALLERALQAMRKLDRRVTRMLQDRLDLIIKQELIARHAQDCIAAAGRLLQENPLMPNLVADMDRSWRSIGEVGEPYLSEFAMLRAKMDARLAAQTALQRSVIDSLEALRRLNTTEQSVEQEDLAGALSQFGEQMEAFRASPEVLSLPRHLLTDFEQAHRRLAETLAASAKQAGQADAHHEALASWEAAPASSLDGSEINRIWGALPPLQNESEMHAVQQRFDALIARLPAQTEQQPDPVVSKDDATPDFVASLQAMERAVLDGALLVASEQDEVIRTLDLRALRVSSAQMARLNNVRAELKRLQGWARWGGKVSREELIRSVELLTIQKMPLQELAKKVSAAREQWKSLDVSAGAAPKPLWERFDAACSTAYAPVAEHSKMQARERQLNKSRAEELVAGLHQFASEAGLLSEDADHSVTDWKQVANTYRSAMQSWQRIGHMDRKDRKRLDADFIKAIELLQQPLQRRWNQEIARRNAMIAEVEQFTADDRKALDRVRVLQQQWQEYAKAIPLERKDEQALWQRFRLACNAVFAQRKQTNQAADAERDKNAKAKDAISASLEQALSEPEPTLRKLLRESERAWKGIGAVPRAREKHIEERYRKAVAAVNAKIEATKRLEKSSLQQVLIQKLLMCCTVESALTEGLAHDPEWVAQWQMLPPLPGARESAMKRRFDAAMGALQSSDRAYAALLERNRAALQKDLLRAEMLAGITSPPDFAKERMKMQVELLQASMSGIKEAPLGDVIERLSALPALMDKTTADRLHRLLSR